MNEYLCLTEFFCEPMWPQAAASRDGRHLTQKHGTTETPLVPS